MAERFDAIVVGAGPSGNTAAYVMAKAGMKVLQLERGEYPGSKNVQGAILYVDALEAVIPNCRKQAPLERAIIEQRMWLMDDRSHVGSHYRGATDADEQPTRYTVIRANLDKWFSKKVQEAGALLICETTVVELLKEGKQVVGVRTDRANGDIRADVVVLADGVNSLVATKSGLRPPIQAKDVALAVKEMHFLPKATIEERFNIPGEHGVVIEMFGKITKGMVGTGFLYTNKESVSVGVGCMVDDFRSARVSPYQLLEELKQHPSVKPLIAGSEVKEYSAHLIPEGGRDAMGELGCDGMLVAGDAAALCLAAGIWLEGVNFAIGSGAVAGRVAARAARSRAPEGALGEYRTELEATFVLADHTKLRGAPHLVLGERVQQRYPEIVCDIAQGMFTVENPLPKPGLGRIARNALKRHGVRLRDLARDGRDIWRSFG